MKIIPTIENLTEIVSNYDKDAIPLIKKAYEFATNVHKDQKRKSGELYIIHPLYVANILACLHADPDTICAGLLHDVIEDGENLTKEDIEKEFNLTIATLTDGVTKMKLELFPNKEAQNNANTRKTIMSLKKDVRVILIKLADRLHNMLTLEHLPRDKQIQNARETLELYVPLADYLGIQQIKNILEELSLKYLNYDIYNLIAEKREIHIAKNLETLENTATEISKQLTNIGIKNTTNYRFKRTYAIYDQIAKQKKISPKALLNLRMQDILPYINLSPNNIHDLNSLKILVTNLIDCYKSLELLQYQYETIPGKTKNCIINPKTNGYQSIHTTILDKYNEKLQTQIRTADMEKKALLGIASYWQTDYSNASTIMNEELINKFPFFNSLLELDSSLTNDYDFITQTRQEILSNLIYPHTKEGKIIELPEGATIIDFACKLNKLNTEIIAIVNGKVVPTNYILKSKDNVEIIPISTHILSSNNCTPITIRAKKCMKILEKA